MWKLYGRYVCCCGLSWTHLFRKTSQSVTHDCVIVWQSTGERYDHTLPKVKCWLKWCFHCKSLEQPRETYMNCALLCCVVLFPCMKKALYQIKTCYWHCFFCVIRDLTLCSEVHYRKGHIVTLSLLGCQCLCLIPNPRWVSEFVLISSSFTQVYEIAHANKKTNVIVLSILTKHGTTQHMKQKNKNINQVFCRRICKSICLCCEFLHVCCQTGVLSFRCNDITMKD